MDGRVGERKDGWMNGWMDGWKAFNVFRNFRDSEKIIP